MYAIAISRDGLGVWVRDKPDGDMSTVSVKMSGSLAPSKSTVYVGNLPYSLTNNDIHKIFDKYGKIARVTIVRDKVTRESKGVAFVLFVDKMSAQRAVLALNRKELFGRTLKCTIAMDNGRAPEFIRRRIYKDKSRCYECGDVGHLSYRCPQNTLGDREMPKKKPKKRKGKQTEATAAKEPWSEEEEEIEDDDLSLAEAIRLCQVMREREEAGGPSHLPPPSLGHSSPSPEPVQRKKLKPDTYFSDEDASDQD